MEDQMNEIYTFKKAYANKIAPKTMRVYLIALKQILDGKLNVTSKSKHLQVKALLSKCEKVGIEVDYNLVPWSKRGDNFKANVADKLISEEQLKDILNTCPNTQKGNDLRLAINISYYAGLRLSEALNLKKRDILPEKHIRLKIAGKGGKFRNTYLPLDFRNKIEGFDGFNITEDYVKIAIARMADKLGMNFSFHSFRHSYATNLLNKGIPIQKVSSLLGHASIATTAIYLHCVDTIDDSLKSIGY